MRSTLQLIHTASSGNDGAGASQPDFAADAAVANLTR